MKKILFCVIMLMTISNVMYASFPVKQNSVVLTQADEQAVEAPVYSSVDWGLAVICFFVGSLGIHRFIMGDTTYGILMLLTLGGLGIWTLIDFIRILTGDMSR